MSFLEGDLWGAIKIFFLLSFFFCYFVFLILLSVALGV